MSDDIANSDLNSKPDLERKTENLVETKIAFTVPNVTESDESFIGDDESTQENVSPESYDDENSETESGPHVEFMKYSGQLSTKGEKFDPFKHQCPPNETAGGKWQRKLKKQREEWNLTSDKPAPKISADLQQQARNVASTYAETHRLVFGEHGGILNPEDIAPLAQAWEEYLAANPDSAINIPPELKVALCSINYTVAVAQREENIEKTRGWMGSVKSTFKKLIGKGGDNAQSDNREQRDGKNETSATVRDGSATTN